MASITSVWKVKEKKDIEEKQVTEEKKDTEENKVTEEKKDI